MKLCVFQGTFNPIHNAHLDMAKFVLNKYDFDKIIFIPAFKPPHKEYDKGLSRHRLNMVRLATADDERFDVSDIEYKSDRTSYTYLTIKELYTKYEIDDKIYFIIGTDAFEKIDTWYEAEKLKKLVKFIVFNRTNNDVKFSSDNEKQKNGSLTDYLTVDGVLVDELIRLTGKDSTTIAAEILELELNGTAQRLSGGRVALIK